jgi:hypothetical protein
VLIGTTIATVAATLLALVLSTSTLEISDALVPTLWALIVLAAMGAILRKIRTFDRVNLQAVLGLLTVYLLLGLFFAYLFMFAAALRGSFFVQGETEPSSFVYYSYITLATVGYGDLTPLVGAPRALAVGEAITGQLYLVSVVALAVGRFGRPRVGSSGPDRGDG